MPKKQQYTWMLALFVALQSRDNADDRDDDGERPRFTHPEIDGVSGRVRHGQSRAANDLAAQLIVLLLILVAVRIFGSAKYRAKVGLAHAFSREMARGAVRSPRVAGDALSAWSAQLNPALLTSILAYANTVTSPHGAVNQR